MIPPNTCHCCHCCYCYHYYHYYHYCHYCHGLYPQSNSFLCYCLPHNRANLKRKKGKKKTVISPLSAMALLNTSMCASPTFTLFSRSLYKFSFTAPCSPGLCGIRKYCVVKLHITFTSLYTTLCQSTPLSFFFFALHRHMWPGQRVGSVRRHCHVSLLKTVSLYGNYVSLLWCHLLTVSVEVHHRKLSCTLRLSINVNQDA